MAITFPHHPRCHQGVRALPPQVVVLQDPAFGTSFLATLGVNALWGEFGEKRGSSEGVSVFYEDLQSGRLYWKGHLKMKIEKMHEIFGIFSFF